MADGGEVPTLVKVVTSMDVTLPVIHLLDNAALNQAPRLRTGVRPVASRERPIHGSKYAASTGAMYALLRSGLGHRALPLKKNSIQAGLVTQQEFGWLRSQLNTSESRASTPSRLSLVVDAVAGIPAARRTIEL